MSTSQRTTVEWIRRAMPFDLLFFALAFVTLWRWVEPHVLYRAFGTIVSETSAFSTGASFFSETVRQPGGVVVYLSGLLSQGFSSSPLGASIIVLVGMSLCVLARLHLAHARLPRWPVVTCLPAVVVFVLYGQYKHPLAACLAVAMGLLFALVFEKLPGRKGALRLLVYSGLAAGGYAVMGAGGVWVFALMTVVHLVFVGRRAWLSPIVVVVTVALIWGLAEYVYLLPAKTAFLILTPLASAARAGFKPLSQALLIALYVLVPATVLVLSLGTIVTSRLRTVRTARPRKAKSKKTHAAGKPKIALLAPVTRGIAGFAPIVLLALGLTLTRDPLNRAFVRINAAARQQQWSDVLTQGRQLPKGQSNVPCNHDINRALYHTGRLPYEMFSFPQNPRALLLNHEKRTSSLTQMQLCEAFGELGNINTAEKMAAELLAVQGNLGSVLESLAWISIIKGRPETARTYLNVLRKDLVYRDTAAAMLDGLSHGFAPDRAAHIDAVRSYMPDDPYGSTYGGSIEQILTGLLARNRHNRMAFEYLMASYLLTGQPDKVAANLDRLRDFAYPDVPTLYEEAVLIHYGMQGRKADLAKLNIRPETFQRYLTFVQLDRSLKSPNRQAALNRLVREFGTSYFFYFRFGRIGVI